MAAFEPAELAYIVGLSLTVSFSATAVAAIVGLPCGAALAICQFPGRRLLILLANAFLGLPPVVVGLGLYLMLSRSGPLGELALLFTPGGMVLAQTVLATPIITALAHRAIEAPWQELAGEQLQVVFLLYQKGRDSRIFQAPATADRLRHLVGGVGLSRACARVFGHQADR
jgi:ABC-type tungstate transport system substrate-binding protein